MLIALKDLAKVYTLEEAISVMAGVNEDAFYKPPTAKMLKSLERHTPTIDSKEAPLPSTALGSAMGKGEVSSPAAANLASSTSTATTAALDPTTSTQTPLGTQTPVGEQAPLGAQLSSETPLGLLSSAAATLDPLSSKETQLGKQTTLARP
jgi:hypothetical protein